jgi:hypothetical protein
MGHEQHEQDRMRVQPENRAAAEFDPEGEGRVGKDLCPNLDEPLLQMARGHFGHVADEAIVALCRAVAQPGDELLVMGAMQALIRRARSAANDELTVVASPGRAGPLGLYQVGQRRSRMRPYRTLVSGVAPLSGSCSCRDFTRGSLGLCKHLLVALDWIFQKPRRLARAERQQASRDELLPAEGRLAWDPLLPLFESRDWLTSVRWARSNTPASRLPKAARELETWLKKGGDGFRVPSRQKPAERLGLVEALSRFATASERRIAKTMGAENKARAPLGLISVEPALVVRLDEERAELERRQQLQKKQASFARSLATLKGSLYPYQRAGVERFLERGRLLLADDMGLGKTVQTIAAMHALTSSKLVQRVLLVVPASLKLQWQREITRFSSLSSEAVFGGRIAREKIYRRTARGGVLIINYEQLLYDLALVQDWAPELVVLDEAQRIKNWATRTAKQVKAIDSPYRLVLTGTPLENRLAELASIMDWVDDMALEPKWRLSPMHILPGGKGARHLDVLRARLTPVMLRRQRSEVLDDLPPRTDTVIPVEMTRRQAIAHDECAVQIVRLVAITRRRALRHEEFMRLMSLLTIQRMASNAAALLDFEEAESLMRGWPHPNERALEALASPKLAELRELVRNLVCIQGRKLIVFSQWRRMLQLAKWATADLLGEHGYQDAFFSGEETPQRRAENVRRLHDDDRLKILFCTDAGGVGLNLQRASSCLVNLELPWNPAVLEQRIGRVYRLGQSEPVEIYNLICQQGIESRITQLVGNKKALFSGIFDGKSEWVEFDQAGSFIERASALFGDDALEHLNGDSHEQGDDDDEAGIDSVGPMESLEPLASVSPIAAKDMPLEHPLAAVAAPRAQPPTREPTSSFKQTSSSGSLPVQPSQQTTASSARTSSGLAQLFDDISLRREPGGRVVLEASGEAAETLSTLFEGMARLLRGQQ